MLMLTSCSDKPDIRTIKIYNWVDYIDESILDQFVDYFKELTGETITYVYDTFETNESMYNTVKTGKTDYDVICPSEYMIQKMIREDMLEKFDLENYDLDLYQKNASLYLQNLFKDNKLDSYAACYMWGTLGLIYNPEALDEAAGGALYDKDSWEIMENPMFEGLVSLKDSVRDAYCVGSLLAHKAELKEVENKYTTNSSEYQKAVQDIINRTTPEAIELVSNELRNLKQNIYGLEVDSGKGDIVTGKIAMNVAWSGDAVYSMDLAEEEDTYLEYMVPREGGNVWFDGWVMPKGADIELAQAFINFLSQPEIAALNMEYIGYTSSIAGDAIFDLIEDWYGITSYQNEIEELEQSKANLTAEELESVNEQINSLKEELNEITTVPQDLTYFFEGTLSEEKLTDGLAIVNIDESYINRQFSTQYPSEECIKRCGVMQDFGDRNEAVLEMWINVKANKASPWLISSLVFFVLVVAGLVLYSKRSYFARIRRFKKYEKK
jgi:spermidine/putrescine transport system substrate-binding protein